MNLGPHTAFIVASYAAAAIVIAALVGWVIADGSRLARRLAELEARGMSRRGGTPNGGTGISPGGASDA